MKINFSDSISQSKQISNISSDFGLSFAENAPQERVSAFLKSDWLQNKQFWPIWVVGFVNVAPNFNYFHLYISIKARAADLLYI